MKNDNNFDGKLNDINYKRTAMKLHDANWKNIFSNFDGVSMLGYGCGVSQYPQFYDRDLDKYQVLPHPYLGSLEFFPREKSIKENGC